MKKITCKAMGGSCDAVIKGETAEEMMKNGKQHVHDSADAGDKNHQAMIVKMKAMSDEDYKKWAADFTSKFDTLEQA